MVLARVMVEWSTLMDILLFLEIEPRLLNMLKYTVRLSYIPRPESAIFRHVVGKEGERIRSKENTYPLSGPVLRGV